MQRLFLRMINSQVSAMLTVAEMPGIYVNKPGNELFVFDHVVAEFEGNRIKITNPTKFDARICIFIDEDNSRSYPQGFVSICPKILIKAGTTGYYTM